MLKVQKFFGIWDIRWSIHWIGIVTWVVCLTEMYYFSKYFQQPATTTDLLPDEVFQNRRRIDYLAVGLAGYAQITPCMSWIIVLCDDH